FGSARQARVRLPKSDQEAAKQRLLNYFFFSSRRRHTRSVSAFLLNRSSDLRITIPLTLSNLKLLRRITRTENILHRNFTRRQVAIQNRVASNIGISQIHAAASCHTKQGRQQYRYKS